jgi:tRNA (cytidine/uridine-2'-O-)-methyltransferase
LIFAIPEATRVRLALYQPDIPQNTGAMMRLAACLGVPLDIIEPCGFILDDRRLRRAGMDYIDHLEMKRHASWDRFASETNRAGTNIGRLVLLTTRASVPYLDFSFNPGDTLLMGSESAGVPDEVADQNTHEARSKVAERGACRGHGAGRGVAANVIAARRIR